MTSLAEKEQQLRELLRSLPKALIAYSGGVDSAYLLWVAHQELGSRVLGILADSPSLKRQELADSQLFAQTWQLPLRVIATRELENPAYQANPLNRCFHCKHELFDQMQRIALLEAYPALCYGENADDAGELRPGQKAAQEFRVLAPLREAGLSKADIRALARAAGLSVADKTAQPCLSSRIPHGLEVTPEKLQQIEKAEAVLEQEGFRIFRVRHHGERALVLVSPEETPQLLKPDTIRRIAISIQSCGFQQVDFDPLGYRGASLR
ncbi:MAG: ATP-dependent sacrificial sulfur transferase LarE [Blastochloris sp.]|nr:ATP-dependent sacrificial sulfur transferase LarE [Blastochloris sp.]